MRRCQGLAVKRYGCALGALPLNPSDFCNVGVYNGCENIFRSIARFFENDLGPTSWHKDLLKRMRMEIPGYRPKVIDDELYIILDDFRFLKHNPNRKSLLTCATSQ